MRFRLSLYSGKWQKTPCNSRLKDLFDGRFPFLTTSTLEEFIFIEPDDCDVGTAVELIIESEWFDAEVVRDAIVRAILDRFDPEYESMVEVEILEED